MCKFILKALKSFEIYLSGYEIFLKNECVLTLNIKRIGIYQRRVVYSILDTYITFTLHVIYVVTVTLKEFSTYFFKQISEEQLYMKI